MVITRNSLFITFTIGVALLSSITAACTAAPTTPPTCDISAEEYAVYSALITARYLEPGVQQIVITDHTDITTATDDIKETVKGIQDSFPGLPRDLVAALPALLPMECPLQGLFALSVPVELVSQEEAAPLIRDNWEPFYEKYPGAQGKMEFSRVIFNRAGDMAIVYVGNMRGGLNGEGYFILLSKKDGQWLIDKEAMVWIA